MSDGDHPVQRKRPGRRAGEHIHGRGDVVERGRPATVAAHPAVLDVPGRVPGRGEVGRERPAELESVPLAPEPAVHDDNHSTWRAGREGELAELAGVVTVGDP